ncbi:uncharacterized protein LOC101894980 [Musca domestica]|uniref:Uncharacterized protein LOC101894980 n=1 Tax=Musca domestica TaxID=7370 RepID=A0A1I8MSR9_MUSDO|nr:uncharacterized protein LOC101894980 [Musca domestica]
MHNLEKLKRVCIIIALANGAYNICKILEHGLRYKGSGVVFGFSAFLKMDVPNLAILILQLSVVIMAFLLVVGIKMKCRLFVGFWLLYSIAAYLAQRLLTWLSHSSHELPEEIIYGMKSLPLQVMVIYPIYVLFKAMRFDVDDDMERRLLFNRRSNH